MSINPSEFTDAIAKRGLLKTPKKPAHCPGCLKPDTIDDDGIFWQCRACGWKYDVIERTLVLESDSNNGESEMADEKLTTVKFLVPNATKAELSDHAERMGYQSLSDWLRHAASEIYQQETGETLDTDAGQWGGHLKKDNLD